MMPSGRANRRKMGPATWPLVIPVPTESDRYRTSGYVHRIRVRTNSVLAAREGTVSHLAAH